MTSLVPLQRIERKILLIRGQKVLLDSDLAELYGVPTKRLNEQVKRNGERFPKHFMFQLTHQELEILRSQFATSNPGVFAASQSVRFSSPLPLRERAVFLRLAPFKQTLGKQGEELLLSKERKKPLTSVRLRLTQRNVSLRRTVLSLKGRGRMEQAPREENAAKSRVSKGKK
jgi:hypothetical protein